MKGCCCVDICVNLSPDDAASLLEEHILSSSEAELLDKYIANGIYILVFDKYFFRINSSVGLTVTIHLKEKSTIVHLVAAGCRSGLAENDFGVGKKFANSVEKILEEYIVK